MSRVGALGISGSRLRVDPDAPPGPGVDDRPMKSSGATPAVVIVVFGGDRLVGWLLPTGAPAQPFAGTLELFSRLAELTTTPTEA
jgi:hypothetical protein